MTGADQLDQLEAALLQLGQLELATETALERLFANARACVVAGDAATAEAIWQQHDRIALRLKALKAKIYAVENQLYAKRRRVRR